MSNAAYAKAMLDIAEADVDSDVVLDEMHRFGEALAGSEELVMMLGDKTIPAGRRQQIVEDLLDGKANTTTVGLVSMAVAAGKSRELPEIINKMVSLGASHQNRQVAYVRSAVALSEDQMSRLASALKNSVGGDVDIKATVDPSVVGGIVTTIGDTVIDGSIHSRLGRLREAF